MNETIELLSIHIIDILPFYHGIVDYNDQIKDDSINSETHF